MVRLLKALILFLPLLLAACAEPVWAPEEAVQKAIYRHNGPPAITLVTMINNRSGEGGHSALLINASQRVVFDPAGTWHHPTVPERNDVLFGMTPTMWDFYLDYHARESYHVVLQTVQVSPEIAELALRRVQEYGAVPKTQCSNSVSNILRGIPGFETVSRSLWPRRTMESFGALPGVVTQKIYDDSPDDNVATLGQQLAAN
jgi:hypothetical protein